MMGIFCVILPSSEDNNRKEDATFESHRVHSFSIKELRRATQNFDEGNILGRGGFGQVYKVCIIIYTIDLPAIVVLTPYESIMGLVQQE
jgi:hypothetical protein